MHTCSIVYLQHSCVSAEETRLSSFSLFEVWFAGWVSLLSPPPPRPGPIPPSEDLTWNDFHIGLILAADWPGESALPQGSPTNGDTAAWLIGRGQVAPLHFSFFCFKQQPLHCLFSAPFYHLVLRLWERGVGSPVVRTFTKFRPHSKCTLDYSPLLLFFSAYHLFGCNYGRCHPNPPPLRLVMNYSLGFHVSKNNDWVSLRGFSSKI